jgi:ribonucleoside-diphosphate reductase alpha chain
MTPVPKTVTENQISERISNNIGEWGLKISRYFTKDNSDSYVGIKFEKRTSKITNPDGSTVFKLDDVEVPEFWSQVATDILAQKYFRKKGVPQYDEHGNMLRDEKGEPILGSEKSAKQTMARLAETWRWWGEKYGYFDSANDAQAFEDEIKYLLMRQMMAPNSPQWFNTGLNYKYGITGGAQGHWYVDPETEELKLSENAYLRPQVHACFIQGLSDDLVNPGGIMDLVLREARVFKYGSGTGSNFSNLRGRDEMLSGGGKSSGMMSFLNIFDAAAGSIKSGGTTRRAAKMVTVDIDHPEIEQFINWKAVEEQKVASLVAGSMLNEKHLKAIVVSAETKGLDAKQNPELRKLIRKAKADFVPLNYIKRALMMVQNGVKAASFDYRVFDTDFRSEAYLTVGGQNSNNSVRVNNEFLKAVENDGDWQLVNRTDKKVAKTMKARALWEQIVQSAWQSADPGLQYHSTINEWHTCKADGEIVASNPCSEYMFLDDTACNLAQTAKFDLEGYRHAIRLTTIILEISVLMAQLPSREIAERTHNYRTLGLGYANIGALLMMQGIPYDSNEGFAITGALTAILTGESYATSAEMAKAKGAFNRFEANREHMLRVMRNHTRAAYNVKSEEYENLTIKPLGIDAQVAPADMLEYARQSWDYALELGQKYGYRNAQTTVIAPTGTIGLVMDCDTTGVEPDFALVKFKKLVGGGYFKIVNQSVIPALKRLGYSTDQIEQIQKYIIGHQTLVGAPDINVESLKAKGFTDNVIAAIEAVLPGMFELKYAFTKWTLGEEFCRDVLKLSDAELNDFNLNILHKLGFNDAQIDAAERYVCGNMTIEGAPGLKPEHLPVFDCANKNGKYGQRFIRPLGHIMQMAAAQPFISGAISKTINLPEEASFQDVSDAYMDSWKLMIKANALYRDGSKLSQPLNTGNIHDTFAALFSNLEDEVDETVGAQQLQQVVVQQQKTPVRRRLPDERHSITHKFNVNGTEGYVNVGLFEDGTPGEMFITMQKAGSTLNGIMDAFAVSVSMNLQYGVPLETLVRKYVHTRFEPAGMTGNREIPIAKSVLDYLFRWMALKFLDADKAKLYHNAELVDMAYSKGSNFRVKIPYINGKGHTELKFQTDNHASYVVAEPQAMAAPAAVATATPAVSATVTTVTAKLDTGLDADLDTILKSQRDIANKTADGDAPLCTNCGSVTQRQGTCYYCPNCGETTGCS